MKTTKALLVWALALAPLVITAALYSSLPDMIPMHWGAGGTVRYDSKVNIWWLAGLSPAMAGLFMLLPKIDPLKKNYEKFRGVYDSIVIVMMLFMLGVVGLVLSESFNPGRLEVEFLAVAAIGLLFVFLGNIMPKVKSNFFVGVRTPWTLSSTEVWNKTHRLAGFVWFFGGLLVLAAGFLLRGTALFTVFGVIIAVMTLIPVVMSYIWFKNLSDSN